MYFSQVSQGLDRYRADKRTKFGIVVAYGSTINVSGGAQRKYSFKGNYGGFTFSNFTNWAPCGTYFKYIY